MVTQKLEVQGWNSVSEEDKTRIESIIKSVGVVSGDFTIEADPEKPDFDSAESSVSPESFLDRLCKIGCDTAAATAGAACSAVSGGVAIAACIAAVEAARQLCRDAC